MEGLIDRLQSGDAEVQRLLERADFYLVPNMNPDGAFHGHLRTNAAGKDLNRAWAAPSAEESPEVLFVQEQMAKYGVDLFLDVHGDEEIPFVFAAGCEGNPEFTPRLDRLESLFRERLEANGEFQSVHGYPKDAPGQANLTLACNHVGRTYDCLSLTLEMPFKDHNLSPNPRTGWSGRGRRRSRRQCWSRSPAWSTNCADSRAEGHCGLRCPAPELFVGPRGTPSSCSRTGLAAEPRGVREQARSYRKAPFPATSYILGG